MAKTNVVKQDGSINWAEIADEELAAECARRLVESEGFEAQLEVERENLAENKKDELEALAARYGFTIVKHGEKTKKITRARIDVSPDDYQAVWDCVPDKKSEAATWAEIIAAAEVNDPKVVGKIERDFKKAKLLESFPKPDHSGRGKPPNCYYAAKGAKIFWETKDEE